MQTGRDLIERHLPPGTIRACVAGTHATVALTEKHFVIAEPRPCEMEVEVQRYPLAALTGIRCLRDAHGGLLALEFHGVHTRLVLFPEEAAATADALVGLLRCPVKKVLHCERCVVRETIADAA